MSQTNNEPDFLDLPDDQILGMTAPVNAAPATDVIEPLQPASSTEETRGESVADGSTPPASAGDANADGATDSTSVLAQADEAGGTPPATITPPVAAQETPKEGAPADEAPKTGDTAPASTEAKTDAPKVPTADDHKALYELVLGGPIKANGREIRLQSPDEAVKLIQMGLNYTKKMQTLQPALRVVKMLENNGLMDEAKLSHLIDISKGDSGAIQKLLADKGFDPVSADAEQAAKYVPADHRVSDLEMSFDTVLGELEQTPAGVELIAEVHGQWDADSKRALFQKPQLLTMLAEQKATGLYAQISGEVDRLRALGQITPDIPFLQAYHAVGDMLHTQGRLATKAEAPAVETPAVPVETRVLAPTPEVKNTAQAQATAPVRTAPSNPAPTTPNYLEMSDAEFAKQMAGRV